MHELSRLLQYTPIFSKSNIQKFHIELKNRITLQQGNIFNVLKDSRPTFKVLNYSAYPDILCVLLVALGVFSGMQMNICMHNSYA